MLTFFETQGRIVAERAEAGEELLLPESFPAEMSSVEAATLVDFSHMLLNSNEFVYRN